MEMQLIGAGLGRTGTASLQLALQRLLPGPCYHMLELFGHPEHVAVWHAAVKGDTSGLPEILDAYSATVDWPGGAFWHDLADQYPDAVVLLSTRSDSDTWWRSANATIFSADRERPPADSPMGAWGAMVEDMLDQAFTPGWRIEAEAKAAYEAHNADVRATAPADRLVEWQPGDGWEPLCQALGVEVPDEEFPHTNTTAEFRLMMGLDTQH